MSAVQTAALLRRIADAIEAGEVPGPHLRAHFIISGEQDQGAALTAAAGLFPGMDWQATLTRHYRLAPVGHVTGTDGRLQVTISGDAAQLPASVVCGLTGEHQQPEGAAA